MGNLRKVGKKMNKVILIGRLTKDVELRYTQTNNTAVASFTLAVNRRVARDGEERKADFFNIVVWNKLAETASKHLNKGMQVGIVGNIQNRFWETEDGTKKYITEIIAEEVEFLDSKRREGPDPSILTRPVETSNQKVEENINESFDNGDDLPF